MKNKITTSIKIKRGEVKTSSKITTQLGSESKILTVDLDSKYCEVSNWKNNDIPVIELIGGDNGIHLNKLQYSTKITLTEFKDWRILKAYVVRYTLYVILYKQTHFITI
jgi:hypothetical protein